MNCINCGAAVNIGAENCPYCGTHYSSHSNNSWNPAKNKKIRKIGIYPLFIGFGIITAIAVYGLYFDNFSEYELINITPIWYFALVFGLYGYKAESLMMRVVHDEADDFRDAFKKWLKDLSKTSPILFFTAALFYFPLPLCNRMSPLMTAATGALIWGVLLAVFFQGIFPHL
jgi:hypothetical protein